MLGSLASLGSLVRMSAILHERGKSIPACLQRMEIVLGGESKMVSKGTKLGPII